LIGLIGYCSWAEAEPAKHNAKIAIHPDILDATAALMTLFLDVNRS
jgi:hypothetical protein